MVASQGVALKVNYIVDTLAMVVAQAVVHRTKHQEVPSSIPTGSSAFLFVSLSPLSISGANLNRSLVGVQHY